MRNTIPVCLLLCLFCSCQPDSTVPTKPNIIYILADDLGYGELGSYGQTKIKTPNLDRMAAEGIRFTQHYSGSPVCAPSRCTLLTGKHTGHAYIRDNYEVGGWGPDEPEGQLPLRPEEVTIGEMLKEAGYATAAIGKWGLGGPGSVGHPNNQGFDLFYGYLCQRVAHNYYPTHLWRNNEADSLKGNTYFSAHQQIEAPLATEQDYYDRFQGETFAPDLMIEEALSFIEDHADRPFFLVFETPVPHVALQVPIESLEPYRNVFDDQPYIGDNGYLPHPLPRAAYAAMISRMDRDIGRMMDLLKDLGLDEQTLVMFSSDNGTTYVSGVEAEFYNSVGPLRGLKGSVYEGGIRVPMLARWPGHIEPGSVTDHPSAFWDVLPTIADITGQEPPSDIDGLSFLPVLTGETESQPSHEYLYWEYHSRGGMQAVRMGEWKAVRLGVRDDVDAPIQLYNLALDVGETTDVAEQHTDLVRKAHAIMAQRTPSPVDRFNFGRRD